MIVERSTNCPYCGEGHLNSCYIQYDNGDYCFSCHKGSKGKENAFAYKILPMQWLGDVNPEFSAEKATRVPTYTPNPKEFSLKTLEWLNQYYIYEKEIKLYNIAYCPPQYGKEESLLFPIVIYNGVIEQFQRRYFPSKEFYSSRKLSQCIFEIESLDNCGIIVVVEDFISAIRVGEHTATLCLFGTKLNDIKIERIIRNYNTVLVWLDDDEPGQKAALEIKEKLTREAENYYTSHPYIPTQRAFTVGNICNQQPKELSPNEIKKLISATISTLPA